jgi:hypothetical protein
MFTWTQALLPITLVVYEQIVQTSMHVHRVVYRQYQEAGMAYPLQENNHLLT